MPLSLCEEAIGLLRNRPRYCTLIQIEKDTGLNRRWLSGVSQGEILNPGSTQAEILRDYMVEFHVGNPLARQTRIDEKNAVRTGSKNA